MPSIIRRCRTASLVVAVSAAICAWPRPSSVAATEAPPTTAPSQSAELARLRQAEVDELRKAVELSRQLYMRGLGPSADLFRLNRMLLETRLRLATSPAERVAVLNDGLKSARTDEELSAARFKAGLASAVEQSEAKIYRLRVEEQLAEVGAK